MSDPVTLIPLDSVSGAPLTPPPFRPTAKFMFAHPAHVLALGFGSGLSRIAPGTSGTLWAWVAFVALQPWLGDVGWAWLIGGGTLLGSALSSGAVQQVTQQASSEGLSKTAPNAWLSE